MTKRVKKEKELKTVSVVRYVRPNTTDEHSNMGGITFVFTMDYDARTVEVRYSICSPEDNFDKGLGRQLAMAQTPEVLELDGFLDRADEHSGFVNYYIRYLIVKPTITKRDRLLISHLEENVF